MFKLSHYTQKLVSAFSPCLLCEVGAREYDSLCKECWQQLPWLKQNIERNGQQILAACTYTYPVDRIIQQFKYQQKLYYQALLGNMLQQLRYPKVQAIVPMPISQERLIERGFNQSLLLAKQLSQHLQIPIWQPVQRLAQHSQKGLSRLERLDGIEQQFIILPNEKRRYRRVLIVDDVVTTGSSISALTQALQRLGCHSTYAVCIAAAQTTKQHSLVANTAHTMASQFQL